MSRCEDEFYESISINDFKDMKNELFITDGTFRDNFEKDFSCLIEGSDVDLDKLKPKILDEKTISVINRELDKLIKLGWGDLLQRFKFRMYLESMRSFSCWGGNHEIEIMKRMLECEILVNFENQLVSVLENSIICLFNSQQIHYHFVLIRAQFLIEFIDRNSEEDCLAYLNIGVDKINYQNSIGSTLLHFAAKNNHARSVNLLINQGAETNIKNHLGQMPLDIATSLNSHALITALNPSIKPDLSDLYSKPNHIISLISDKMHTLHLEIEISETGAQNIAYLIKDAVSELKFNDIGRTELHTAAEEGNDADLKLILSSLGQSENLLHSLVNASVNGGGKQTALHLAAKNNRVKAAKLLLENKAEVNVRDENSEGFPDLTSLHYAAEKVHLDIVKLLIEKGKAEVDVHDSTQGSPLQRAVRFGQLSVVKYLVGIGANVNSRDQTSISVLSYAAEVGCLNIVHFLVEKGADFNAADENSITPLHHAASCSKWDIVKYLVERGADPNVKNIDSKTALTKVVTAGQWCLAKILIENGALIEGLTEEQIDEVLNRNSISLEGEDAIFNLIGLGNSAILENHINKLVENNLNFLNDVLPKIYEEIKLLNIPLSESVGLVIENQIIKDRLFSDRKLNETSLNSKELNNENIQHRIFLVINAIAISEALNAILSEGEISDIFIFLLKLIAQNIQVLRKHFEHKLPWNEMQFCSVTFLSCLTAEPKHTDVIHKLLLNKARIMKHLRLFKTGLEKLENDVNSDSKHRFTNRSQIIDSVLKFNSGFKDLYEDYELLRDIYSLNRIESYLNPACSVDLIKGDVLVGEQVILRALQVTGECLKNTIESPNMSDKVHHLLIALAPTNIIQIVKSLRDSLSHVEHLHEENETENRSSLLDIQKDLIKLKEEITFISLLKRNFALETFFKRIYECENIKQAKEIICGVEINDGISFQPSDKQNEVFKQVVELTEKFEKEIKTPNADQRMYFERLRNAIAKHKSRVLDIKRKHVGNFDAVSSLFNLIEKDGEMELVRRSAKNEITCLNLQLTNIDSNVCEDISQICYEIYYGLDVKDRSQNIYYLYTKIYQINEFEAKRVKSIDRFKTKMSKEVNYVDETEKTKEIEEKVENILRNISNEIFDNEIKKQFLNEIEIKRKVFRSKRTLINYYSKVTDIRKKFEEKAVCLIDEIEYKSLIEKIKRSLSLDESSFSAHVSNVGLQLKLKKGETRETLFNDFSLSKFKTILNSLNRINGKLDSFGKLIKDVSKESEIAKLSQPFSEFIRSFNEDFSKEVIDRALEKIKTEQKIRLRKYFFEKLEILSKVFPSGKSDLELLSLLKTDNIRLAVEMLVLNLTETLNELSLFEPNRLYLDEFSPVLVGKNLRNYLAHGDPLINILPTNYLISLINHFRLFQRYFHKDCEFYSGEYLIGKGKMENVLQVEYNIEHKLEILNKTQNIFRITRDNRIDEFSRLIDKPFHLKVQSALGMTLLHLSAKTNNLGVFQHLLEHGLSLFYKNIYERSALHFAITAGSEQIIEFLLEKGFESSFLVEKGETLLHLAVQSGHLHIVKLLLRYGADIEAVNNQRIKPIMNAVIEGHKDIVIELINAGVDLESRDKIGRTLLHLATSNVEITKILIERKVNINALDHGLKTPLHLACRNGEEAIVQILLDNEANVNSKTKSGETALHLAAAGGHVKVVEVLLVNKKVEIDAVMDGRYTALHLACFPGHFHVAQLLMKHGADFNLKNIDDTNALHIASWRGHIALLDILFDYPVEIDGLCNGKTVLHLAVESGETKAFRKLFEKGANIFVKDLNGRSVLHFAARSGSVEMMELIFETEKLLGKFEFVNIIDATGRTALHWAVSANQIKCVNFLLENKANVEAKDLKQKTPLLVAAVRGHSDICNILLNNGASVNAKDQTGWSALHFAAQSNNVAIVRNLIQRKVNVNAQIDNGSRTALLIAAQNGGLEIVKLLLSNGADIHFATDDQRTALHFAAFYGHVEIVHHLLKKLELNVNDFQAREQSNGLATYKATALKEAADNGSVSCVKLLVENGADVNATFEQDRTALHHSAQRGEVEVIKILLENAAGVNARDRDGWTALHLATTFGFIDAVKCLLNNEANLNLKDENGSTALHVAANLGFSDILEEILGRDEADVDARDGKNQTPLFRAAQNGHCEVVRLLLNKKADIDAANAIGKTPLHVASSSGDVDTVRLLLNNGATVDFPCEGDFTPLHGAAHYGHLDMAVELVKFGADVNRKTSEHTTPLHVAVKQNKASLVAYLLTLENVEINAKDLVGNTPLHLAVFCGFLDIAEVLIKGRADVNCKSNQNFTPLHLAVKSENCQIVKLLVENCADVNSAVEDAGTALDLAVEYLLINAVETLLENGANITDKSIEFAALLRFFDIFMKLVQWGAGGSEGTALHKAIKCKNEPILELILGVLHEESNWSFDLLNSVMNAVDEDGRTPLIRAAENGYSYAVNLLLSCKMVRVNERATNGMTALHLSALNGHEKAVEMLISKQADANIRDFSGRTAFDLVKEKMISDAEKFQLVAALLLSVTG